ncbi:GntR family transcriptional regulator [Coxiella burnetii]|uniref:GntR family transcriptional regulator n=1 Tax=Coxiella burnetii TaxID=777 RepID=UPI000B95604A|nr:GntR family transcriptional regulator [Coxiella burnetii]OYK80483.1 GntR family transcriptional regulator [Coxiella burnetii]
MMRWDDKKPIYQQLRDKIVKAIIDGSYVEGEMIPSIRKISTEYQINPLTVSKAYQSLLDDNVIEKRRGLGMLVKAGARQRLLTQEKQYFLKKQWPQIKNKLERLGIDLKELLK